MADQSQIDETIAWGTAEIKRFLRRVGLPVTPETMSAAAELDSCMRQGLEAGQVAAELAAFEPRADADVMARMILNQYEEFDRAFRAGELGPDDDDAQSEGSLAQDYTDTFYDRIAYMLNVPEDEANRDLLRRVARALDAGDMEQAEREAKNLITLMKANAGLIQELDDSNDQIGLHPSLDPRELVTRVIANVQHEQQRMADNADLGDPGLYRDGFHDVRGDDRFRPENGGLDTTMPPQPEPQAQERAEPRPAPQPQPADAEPRRPAPPNVMSEDLSLTIDKIIEFFRTGDKRQGAALAAEQAREWVEAGKTDKSVKELAKNILETAMRRMAAQAKAAQELQEAEASTRAEEAPAATGALPAFVLNWPEFRAAAAEFRGARDLQVQRQALIAAIEAAKRAAVAEGVEYDVNPRLILGAISGDAPQPAPQPTAQAEQEERPFSTATLDRVQAQRDSDPFPARPAQAPGEFNDAIEGISFELAEGDTESAKAKAKALAAQMQATDGPYAGWSAADVLREAIKRNNVGRVERDGDSDIASGGVDLELRHVTMVSWPTVSELYAVDEDEHAELQAIATRIVKKGPEDDGAMKSARQILQRAKKKKKKTKFKNARHLVAAMLDAVTRKATKQKLTKPLKPSDIDDGDE